MLPANASAPDCRCIAQLAVLFPSGAERAILLIQTLRFHRCFGYMGSRLELYAMSAHLRNSPTFVGRLRFPSDSADGCVICAAEVEPHYQKERVAQLLIQFYVQ